MIDERRRNQIIVLLETRDDHLPTPARHDASPPGFVAGDDAKGKPWRWLTCEDCLANDRPTPGCETCGGKGRIPDYGPDPYQVNTTQPYGLNNAQRDRDVALDHGITAADRELRRFPGFRPATEGETIEEANKHPYGWERERDRKWRDFDYAALDVALELLRAVDQGGYHMLHAVYVYGWQDVSVVVEHAVARGLVFVDERMPAVIRAPGATDPADAKESLHRGKRPEHEQARQRRIARVLRAHVEWGWSTEQIAAHESLTRRRVQQLLAEHAGVDAAVASGPAA